MWICVGSVICGKRALSLRCVSSVVVVRGLSCPVACGKGSQFPDQGLNPCPLHWKADSLPLDHQGSPAFIIFLIFNFIYLFFDHTWNFPDQGWNLRPLQWKCGVLTTGLPGKSLKTTAFGSSCWESAGKEGVANTGSLWGSSCFRKGFMLTGHHWCMIVGTTGTKIIFAKARVRRGLRQLLGVLEGGEWKMWNQPSSSHLPCGCAPRALSHHQYDLICPSGVCFWLLCVKNFPETNCISAQTICRNAERDTSEKYIWDQLLHIQWISLGWYGRMGWQSWCKQWRLTDSVRLNKETGIKVLFMVVATSPERLLEMFITSKSLHKLIKSESALWSHSRNQLGFIVL